MLRQCTPRGVSSHFGRPERALSFKSTSKAVHFGEAALTFTRRLSAQLRKHGFATYTRTTLTNNEIGGERTVSLPTLFFYLVTVFSNYTNIGLGTRLHIWRGRMGVGVEVNAQSILLAELRLVKNRKDEEINLVARK